MLFTIGQYIFYYADSQGGRAADSHDTAREIVKSMPPDYDKGQE
jgi:hypothetical protein